MQPEFIDRSFCFGNGRGNVLQRNRRQPQEALGILGHPVQRCSHSSAMPVPWPRRPLPSKKAWGARRRWPPLRFARCPYRPTSARPRRNPGSAGDRSCPDKPDAPGRQLAVQSWIVRVFGPRAASKKAFGKKWQVDIKGKHSIRSQSLIC